MSAMFQVQHLVTKLMPLLPLRSTATDNEDQGQVVENVYHNAGNDMAQHHFYGGINSAYGTGWVSEPSVAFARKTWWDHLLETYAPTKSAA